MEEETKGFAEEDPERPLERLEMIRYAWDSGKSFFMPPFILWMSYYVCYKLTVFWGLAPQDIEAPEATGFLICLLVAVPVALLISLLLFWVIRGDWRVRKITSREGFRRVRSCFG